MRDFVQLYENLDSSTSTLSKLDALQNFFDSASDEDKVWVIALFSHRRPPRTVSTTLLRKWCSELSGIPLWLVEETYHVVGDLAETISLLIKENKESSSKTLNQWIREIAALSDKDDDHKREFVIKAWKSLDRSSRLLFNKLITGGFRVGVSSNLIIRALSKHLNISDSEASMLLTGNWDPFTTTWEKLINTSRHTDKSIPYPFYLAYALEDNIDSLGNPREWAAEWKWDGIRCQLVRRAGEVYLWSRGNELINQSFPEFLPSEFEYPDIDFVIDGELVICSEGHIRNFQNLQNRLGRKKPSKIILSKYPAAIICYDLLEYQGTDFRNFPYEHRRKKLKDILLTIQSSKLIFSEEIVFNDWASLTHIREKSRERSAEGLMLKRKNSIYQSGRRRGDWWKWKVDPLSVDAVMIYAQRGHGRRSNLFTDFTFAVRHGEQLIPFTKAYSGLTDKEFNELSQFVRKNTIERFGPVCSVKPTQVFEIAFEGIQRSSRHKSGVALRFPRIKKWRRDKTPDEINTLDDLNSLLEFYDNPHSGQLAK